MQLTSFVGREDEITGMADMKQEIRFTTTTDGANICYATVGRGPALVKAPNWLTHLEYEWQSPVWRHWWQELGKDHLVIRFDQRGCGLSDRSVEDLSFAARVGDLEAVVEAVGLESFALLGISQGGAVAVEYAVRHPDRVSHLVLVGAYARGTRGETEEQRAEREALRTLMKQGWGRDDPAYRQLFTLRFMPEASLEQMRWFNELQRVSASPEGAVRSSIESGKVDVRDRLPLVSTPTLILHARGDLVVPFEEGRLLASMIRNARFVPLESNNHLLLETEPAWQKLLSEVRLFLGSAADDDPDLPTPLADGVEQPNHRPHTSPDGTVTILFTDIEGSTPMTERLGDQRAQEVLRTHNAAIRRQIAAHDGFEVKSQGDGFMVAFSSARRALECAIAIQQGMATQQSEERVGVRIGLHTGEAIKEGEDFFGKNVILAARIASQANAEQILVSSLLKTLVESSGEFEFGEAQVVELKGLAGAHHVHQVKWDRTGG